MEGVILNPDFTDDDFQKLVQNLHLYRGIEDTRSRAEHHILQSKKNLELFEDCATKRTMIMLSDYTIARNV